MRKYSMIHRCPQIRTSDEPSHRGHRPLLFPNSAWVRFFNVPHEYWETGPTVYRPYPRRLESLTICRYITKAALLPQLLKTLSVGPAEIWTCDLPHSSPVLYQLSLPVWCAKMYVLNTALLQFKIFTYQQYTSSLASTAYYIINLSSKFHRDSTDWHVYVLVETFAN